MKRTTSIILGTLIACMTTLSADPVETKEKPSPFIKEGAVKVPVNEGYIAIPVAKAKKIQIQQILDTYSKENKLTDLRTHLFKIQALLISKKHYYNSLTLNAEGEGGESINGATFTFTEDGWLDDTLRGQKYQYTIQLKDSKLTLTEAKAWLRPWAQRFEGMVDYCKKNEWGTK